MNPMPPSAPSLVEGGILSDHARRRWPGTALAASARSSLSAADEKGGVMRRLAWIVVVSGALAGVAAASAVSKPSLKISPNPVRAGHAVLIRGSADGCPVGDTVTLLSHAFPATHEFAGVQQYWPRCETTEPSKPQP
jgi:hypothetical protein